MEPLGRASGEALLCTGLLAPEDGGALGASLGLAGEVLAVHRLAAAPEDGAALGRIRRGSAVFISVAAVCRPPHDSTPGR